MNPKTYQKKPVKVQAVQLTRDNQEEVMKWCGATEWRINPMEDDPKGIILPTYGTPAHYGDYIIKNITKLGETEWLKVTAEKFEESYEAVDG